jgi:hypothetical protein
VDFKQDPYLNQIRNDWNNNQYPTACQACQQSEARGQTSRRSGSNQWYQDHNLVNNQVELVRMDYWTGDQCNLSCVICGPDWSSSWKQELNFEKQNQRAVINGLIASGIAIFAVWGAIIMIEGFYEDFKLLRDNSGIFQLFSVIVLLGITISLGSTHRAVIKYLRMKLDDLY